MKPLILTYILFSGLDAASTHIMLNRGGRELLMPTQNPWAIDTVVASQAVLAAWSFNWLDKHDHGKLARIVGWSVVGLRVGAVAWNFHQLVK